MLEVIYIVRHGYRSNWTVDSQTGVYSSPVRTPTGIAADPALASYGVRQSEQLATHLLTLQPQPDKIYSSPYYRCLQTLAPYVSQLASAKTKDSVAVWLEPGIGEFYGQARFDHPSPATLEILSDHFPHLRAESKPLIVPSKNGESIPMLHDRVAYALHHLIAAADKDPAQPKALLLCTHAAAIIAMGRALTGVMPEDIGEEDFRCFTTGVSKFVRRKNDGKQEGVVKSWDPTTPDSVPDVGWRGGEGVAGGWECEVNSDCSFLDGGEERGWNFNIEVELIRKMEAEKAKDGNASAVPASESGKGLANGTGTGNDVQNTARD